MDKKKFERELLLASKERTIDYWLIFDKETDMLIGVASCKINDGMASLLTVKVKQENFKNEANAALAYEICRYYLNEIGLRYVCDGERSIRHITNYQKYLISVLGFHNAPCKLHIVYHPAIRPIVSLLYPFRKIIQKVESIHKVIYNVSSILKQEEIARKFKNVNED